MITDPSLSVIARADEQLIEFVITGCEGFPPMKVLMNVKEARKLRNDILGAILDAEKAAAQAEHDDELESAGK